MKTKKFSKQLFDKNDAKAREIATKYFTSKGYTIQPNPDQYGPDLIGELDGLTCFIECEIKYNWADKHFPFGSVQFPARKAKFINKLTPVTFFMLNAKCTRALMVDGYVLEKCPMVEVSNKFVKEGEYFFQVPITKVSFVDLV